MHRRSALAPLYVTLCALITALLSAAAFTAVRPARAAQPVRIMPLGDSITGSPGCWRALLWNRLQDAGYTNIDFVGTLPPQGCGIPYDGDNEGHGGYLATNIAAQNLLPGWLSATHPDIVIMHLGTNDVWSDIAPATILAAFSTLVDQMRADNPAMKILVAQILPMNPSNCPQCAQRVVDFNAAIPAWAAAKSTAQSPITVVDQWTGFDTATDTIDGVHPNDSGNQKIAARWFGPLTQALGGTPPTPTPTPTPPPDGSGCTATYTLVNQWSGGFQGEVKVTAGNAAISGWTVTWTFPGGQTVTQAWNATVSSTGSTVTARDAGYNAALAAGASTTFGFVASGNGAGSSPSSMSCTAG